MHYDDAEHTMFDGMSDEESEYNDDSSDSEHGRRMARMRGVAYTKGGRFIKVIFWPLICHRPPKEPLLY